MCLDVLMHSHGLAFSTHPVPFSCVCIVEERGHDGSEMALPVGSYCLYLRSPCVRPRVCVAVGTVQPPDLLSPHTTPPDWHLSGQAPFLCHPPFRVKKGKTSRKRKERENRKRRDFEHFMACVSAGKKDEGSRMLFVCRLILKKKTSST